MGRGLAPLLDAHPDLSGFITLGQGEEAFSLRLQMIEAAQRSIDTQYYIWHDDLTGRVMHNQLLAAADRGVRVRLLLDDMDTAGKDEMLHTIDTHPNIEIRLFNPFANRNIRGLDFVTDTRRVNRRMHIKTLTGDNQVTIFGGRNIGDEYFGADENVGFGDMDVLAVGPIVPEVSSQFDLYWNSEWVYPLAEFRNSEAITTAQFEAFRKSSDTYLKEAIDSKYAEVLRELTLPDVNNFSKIDFTWSRWLLAYDQPSKVVAREVGATTHLGPTLKMGLDKTQNELIIVSPYFVPGPEFTQYLVDTVKRGVRVRILTNSLEANDVSLVHAGYMRYRKDLVAGGIELYELRATGTRKMRKQLSRENRLGSSHSSLHAKIFGFDRRYLFIGSFNVDARSVALNAELGAYFESIPHATKLSGIFDGVLNRLAYRVLLDDSGKLEWLTLVEGEEVRVSKEPDTSWWRRVSTRFLSWVVPESQL